MLEEVERVGIWGFKHLVKIVFFSYFVVNQYKFEGTLSFDHFKSFFKGGKDGAF